MAFCALIALMAAACNSKDDTVLESIPADAGFIIRLNADCILESAGCTKDGESWTPGTGVENILNLTKSGDRDIFDNVLKAMAAIDSENLFVYQYGQSAIATCAVKHPSALAAALEKEFGAPAKKNGFTVYNDVIVMRDRQLWITDDIRLLERAEESAGKSSAVDIDAVSSRMAESGKALSAVINYGQMLSANPYIALIGGNAVSEKYEGMFVSYGVTLQANRMLLDGVMCHADGKAISMAGQVEEINTSFVRLLPANTLLAFAFGKPTREVTDMLMETLKSYGAADVQPYLEALEGSVAFAVAPPAAFDNLLDASKWTVTLSAGYNKAKAEEIIAMAEQFGSQIGTVSREGNKVHINAAQGIGFLKPADFYLCYTDGMLVASTQPVSADQKNSLTEPFEGYYSAGIFSLPADGDIVKGFSAPFGIEGRMRCKDQDFNSECELTGSSHPFIESILLAATDQKFHREAVDAFMRLQNKRAGNADD